MEQEILLKMLEDQTEINITKYPDTESGHLDRVVEFGIREAKYKVEWWVNICYLSCGELMIPFHSISFDGCWPNDFKLNMVLVNSGNRVAIIPLEQC